MNRNFYQLRPSLKPSLLLCLFAILVGAGIVLSQARNSERKRLACIYSVNQVRLETRAKLREWNESHNSNQAPLLIDLGISPDKSIPTYNHMVHAVQKGVTSKAVTVKVYRKGRPDKVLFEHTYPWQEWISSHFEFTLP